LATPLACLDGLSRVLALLLELGLAKHRTLLNLNALQLFFMPAKRRAVSVTTGLLVKSPTKTCIDADENDFAVELRGAPKTN